MRAGARLERFLEIRSRSRHIARNVVVPTTHRDVVGSMRRRLEHRASAWRPSGHDEASCRPVALERSHADSATSELSEHRERRRVAGETSGTGLAVADHEVRRQGRDRSPGDRWPVEGAVHHRRTLAGALPAHLDTNGAEAALLRRRQEHREGRERAVPTTGGDPGRRPGVRRGRQRTTGAARQGPPDSSRAHRSGRGTTPTPDPRNRVGAPTRRRGARGRRRAALAVVGGHRRARRRRGGRRAPRPPGPTAPRRARRAGTRDRATSLRPPPGAHRGSALRCRAPAALRPRPLRRRCTRRDGPRPGTAERAPAWAPTSRARTTTSASTSTSSPLWDTTTCSPNEALSRSTRSLRRE